jgi:hypothetical protein
VPFVSGEVLVVGLAAGGDGLAELLGQQEANL